jgi:hypothetical protein
MTVIAVRKFLLRAVRAVEAGQEPPHVIRTEAQNDLRQVACIATTIPADTDPKKYVTEQLKKEKYWEMAGK